MTYSYEKKKILVTGAGGFIGGHLSKRLKEYGNHVRGVDIKKQEYFNTKEFCDEFNYMPIIFKSYQSIDKERKLIYHTNVMMCLAETFAVVCADCIDDKAEQKNVLKRLNLF